MYGCPVHEHSYVLVKGPGGKGLSEHLYAHIRGPGGKGLKKVIIMDFDCIVKINENVIFTECCVLIQFVF